MTALQTLISKWAAKTVVANGGQVKDQLALAMNPGRVAQALGEAARAVRVLIDIVRAAPGDNPWREATDDEVAQEILAQLATRTQVKK